MFLESGDEKSTFVLRIVIEPWPMGSLLSVGYSDGKPFVQGDENSTAALFRMFRIHHIFQPALRESSQTTIMSIQSFQNSTMVTLTTSITQPSQTGLTPSKGTSTPPATQWSAGEIIAFVTLIVAIVSAPSGWVLKRYYKGHCKFPLYLPFQHNSDEFILLVRKTNENNHTTTPGQGALSPLDNPNSQAI